jgi:hypothetical protein
LNHFFKRLDFGVSDFSPHGLRGTAATLLREHGFGRDVVELLLAHSEKNATVAAYSHVELAAERRRALQFLADRVDLLASGVNVLPRVRLERAHTGILRRPKPARSSVSSRGAAARVQDSFSE